MQPKHFPHLVAELESLRDQYICATPRQRFGVALQRINDPPAIPNQLVTNVSAVEAFARSLVAHLESHTREELRSAHQRIKKREAHNLVADYLKSKQLKPDEHFGEELWAGFRLAVGYRNLLVHECTYIAPSSYLPLVHCCREVFMALSKLSGTKSSRSAA